MTMPIERITTSYYRVPIEPSGDAGHGLLDHEELILVEVTAGGLVGHGYAYTIGRGGRAIQALSEHDLAPLVLGEDAAEVERLWERMWRGLLYVGRGGLLAFAVPADDEARVAAVRRLIGDDRDLMIDANMGWTPDEALERGARLAAHRLRWLEE